MAENENQVGDIELVDETQDKTKDEKESDKAKAETGIESIRVSEEANNENEEIDKTNKKAVTPLSATVDNIASNLNQQNQDDFVRALSTEADNDENNENEIAMGVYTQPMKKTERKEENENDQDNDGSSKPDLNAKQKALGALSHSFVDSKGASSSSVGGTGGGDGNGIDAAGGGGANGDSREILHSRTDTGNSSMMGAITMDSSLMHGDDSEFEDDLEFLEELEQKETMAGKKGNGNDNSCCFVCCPSGGNGSKFLSTRSTAKWTLDDEKQKKLVQSIVFAKKKLRHFLEIYVDYIDDGTWAIPIADLESLCQDVDLSDQTGVFFFSIVLDKQSQKSHEAIWAILRYLASEMPTPVVAELLNHYRIELSRYNQDKVESVIESLVEGSQFPLSTALEMATFFKERSENDLSNVKKLEDFSTKYQLWAVKLLNSVESDYLATMMMNTPSFHHHKTPFEIALESELVDFLSSDRIGRIGNAIWSKPHLMKPKLSEDAFVMKSTSYKMIYGILTNSAYDFYFSPLGFYTIETFLFLIYLGVFTVLSILGGKFNDPIDFVDYFFWICIFGFLFNEAFQLAELGIKGYFQTWENYLDFSLSFFFVLIIFFRLAGTYYEPWTRDHEDIDINSDPNVAFSVIWLINSVLLYVRLYHFLMLSSSEGPLINVTKSMLTDFTSFAKVWVVVLAGFAFASYFMVGDTNTYYGNLVRSSFLTFLAAIGQPDWSEVSSTNDNATSQARADINQFIVAFFSVLGFVLLLNLLIAMMANSYSAIENNSSKEVLLNKVALAYELDTSSKVMPAPFNAFVFIFYLIYNATDFVILALTSSFMNETWTKQWRCRNNKCLFLNDLHLHDSEKAESKQKQIFQCELCELEHEREYVISKSKRRLLRKPRGMDTKARACCCIRLWKGLQEFFVSDFNWRKSSWICAYCRVRIPKKYPADLDTYFGRIQKMHKLDEDDVNFIKSLTPEVCPHCFRKRRSSLRPVYILEEISYKLFLFTIYPLLRIVLFPVAIVLYFGESQGNSSHFDNFKKEYFSKFNLDPSVVKSCKSLPQGHRHQTLLDLNHPIWEAALDHRLSIEKYNDDIDQFTYAIRQERVEVKTLATRKRDILKISQELMSMVNERAQASIVWDLESSNIVANENTIHPGGASGSNEDLMKTASGRKRRRTTKRRSHMDLAGMMSSSEMIKAKSNSAMIAENDNEDENENETQTGLMDSNSNNSVVNNNSSADIALTIGDTNEDNKNNDKNENENENDNDRKERESSVVKKENENESNENENEPPRVSVKDIKPIDDDTKASEHRTPDGRKVTLLGYN